MMKTTLINLAFCGVVALTNCFASNSLVDECAFVVDEDGEIFGGNPVVGELVEDSFHDDLDESFHEECAFIESEDGEIYGGSPVATSELIARYDYDTVNYEDRKGKRLRGVLADANINTILSKRVCFALYVKSKITAK